VQRVAVGSGERLLERVMAVFVQPVLVEPERSARELTVERTHVPPTVLGDALRRRSADALLNGLAHRRAGNAGDGDGIRGRPGDHFAGGLARLSPLAACRSGGDHDDRGGDGKCLIFREIWQHCLWFGLRVLSTEAKCGPEETDPYCVLRTSY